MSESPGTPTDPHTGERTSLAGLVDAEQRHVLALVDHHLGTRPLTGEEVVGHTLAVLTLRAAIVERVGRGRWALVHQALAAGATVEQTAAAQGMDPAAVRIGLAEWVAEQRAVGLITAERYAAVLDTIAGGAR